MVTFDELLTPTAVYNVVDADGNIVEQNVPFDYPIEEGQVLVQTGTVPFFYFLPYNDTFQAIIDKINTL